MSPLLEDLTVREEQVARLVAAGLANKVIAAELGISEETVSAHLQHIYAKGRVENRAHLASRYTAAVLHARSVLPVRKPKRVSTGQVELELA